MKLTEISYGEQPPVDSYGPGFFRIAGQIHNGTLILSAEGLAPFDGNYAALSPQSFDILLIGTGKDIAPLPADARKSLSERGIAFELMATPAAARTYNVLLSEGRRIAVILTAI